jgi:hypothetical protein
MQFIEVAGNNGRTPFVWATLTRSYNLAYALIKAGANPNAPYSNGVSNGITIFNELSKIKNPTNDQSYIINLINISNSASGSKTYPTYEEYVKTIRQRSSGPSMPFRASGPSRNSRTSGPSMPSRTSGPSMPSQVASPPAAAAAAAPAPPATPTRIPLYLLEYEGDQNLFKENGIENSQIVVKLFAGPHIRSDQELRDRSFTNPVKDGMTVTWKNGSAKVRSSYVANNGFDGMVSNVIYITLDKGVDVNEKVFYLELSPTPAPAAAPAAAPPASIPLYSLEYRNDPKFFKENGIENSQIVVKRFPGPHIRSDQEERENLYKNPDGSLINPVKNGMTVTWKNGSAKVLGSHVANNPKDGMVNKVLYITLDKGVDINEKVFYLQPSGGYRKKSRKRRGTRKSKQTKRR